MWEFGGSEGCILQWDVAGVGDWSPGERSVEGGREPVSPVTGRVLIFTGNTLASQGIFWLCRCGHRVFLAKEG